jgi:murein DD-endopeptidase MepM/ murein hydrolase activator NlpD
LAIFIATHDGHLNVYGHLSEERVTAGQTVTAGARIGAVGNTGNSSACHLHFGADPGSQGGTYYTAMAYLEGAEPA